MVPIKEKNGSNFPKYRTVVKIKRHPIAINKIAELFQLPEVPFTTFLLYSINLLIAITSFVQCPLQANPFPVSLRQF